MTKDPISFINIMHMVQSWGKCPLRNAGEHIYISDGCYHRSVDLCHPKVEGHGGRGGGQQGRETNKIKFFISSRKKSSQTKPLKCW